MDAIVYDKVGKEAEKVREALYGIYPQETITDAAIASFDDGADSIPVKALTVGIEPVQDLHGYDHPWPAGGNQNIIPDGEDTNNGFVTGFYLKADGTMGSGSYNICEYFPVVAGESYTCAKYTDAVANVVAICFYDSDKQYLSGEAYNKRMSFTVVAPTNAAYARTVVDEATAPDLHYFLVAKGTTAPAEWSPYSNICPISGWTGAEVSGTGANIWDEEWEIGSIYDDNGLNNNSRTDVIRSKNYISVKAGESYYYNVPQSYYFVYDSNKTFIKVVYASEKTVITIPVNGCYLRFRLYPSYGTTYNNDVSINYPASDTTYNPYTGNQISVNWEDEAGTVYGGTLTLNPDRTGTLVVDRAGIDLSTVTGWNVSPTNPSQHNHAISGIATDTNNVISELYTNMPEYRASASSMPDGGMVVNNSTLYVTSGSGVNPSGIFVYQLASPQTIQLTAEQISGILPTLYGQNNVWADTGNIEKLTYHADLGKYIDSHITTAVANALNA